MSDILYQNILERRQPLAVLKVALPIIYKKLYAAITPFDTGDVGKLFMDAIDSECFHLSLGGESINFGRLSLRRGLFEVLSGPSKINPKENWLIISLAEKESHKTRFVQKGLGRYPAVTLFWDSLTDVDGGAKQARIIDFALPLSLELALGDYAECPGGPSCVQDRLSFVKEGYGHGCPSLLQECGLGFLNGKNMPAEDISAAYAAASEVIRGKGSASGVCPADIFDLNEPNVKRALNITRPFNDPVRLINKTIAQQDEIKKCNNLLHFFGPQQTLSDGCAERGLLGRIASLTSKEGLSWIIEKDSAAQVVTLLRDGKIETGVEYRYAEGRVIGQENLRFTLSNSKSGIGVTLKYRSLRVPHP